ncbi:VanZ family protein [Silanimonas sp.]|uniref:VanZ family protein n=1 Tax=Silanimonas sp. TaxID=1929290 RepID=UPI0037CC85CF
MKPSPGRRRLDRLAIVVSVVGFAVLLIPMRQDPGLQVMFNLAHVPGFALLALLWAEDLLAREWARGRRLAVVASCGLLMAAATEGLQMLVPGRYADLGDMLRNVLGIALGLGVHRLWPGLLASRIGRD